MTKAIKIEVQPEDIIEAVRKMKERERLLWKTSWLQHLQNTSKVSGRPEPIIQQVG